MEPLCARILPTTGRVLQALWPKPRPHLARAMGARTAPPPLDVGEPEGRLGRRSVAAARAAVGRKRGVCASRSGSAGQSASRAGSGHLASCARSMIEEDSDQHSVSLALSLRIEEHAPSCPPHACPRRDAGQPTAARPPAKPVVRGPRPKPPRRGKCPGGSTATTMGKRLPQPRNSCSFKFLGSSLSLVRPLSNFAILGAPCFRTTRQIPA